MLFKAEKLISSLCVEQTFRQLLVPFLASLCVLLTLEWRSTDSQPLSCPAWMLVTNRGP